MQQYPLSSVHTQQAAFRQLNFERIASQRIFFSAYQERHSSILCSNCISLSLSCFVLQDVNVMGTYQMTRAAEKHLQASGDGAVVNVSSIAGVAAFHGVT